MEESDSQRHARSPAAPQVPAAGEAPSSSPLAGGPRPGTESTDASGPAPVAVGSPPDAATGDPHLGASVEPVAPNEGGGEATLQPSSSSLDGDAESLRASRSTAGIAARPAPQPAARVSFVSLGLGVVTLLLLAGGFIWLADRERAEESVGLDSGIRRLREEIQARNLAPPLGPAPERTGAPPVPRRASGPAADKPDESVDPLTASVRSIWAQGSARDASPAFTDDAGDAAGCRYADVTACIARCEAGHAPSCHRFAEDALFGPADRRNTERGAELLVRLCSSGRSASCLVLGTWLESLAPPKDPDGPALAGELWDYMCEERLGRGCLRKARLLERSGRASDRSAASRAFDDGCRLGEAAACLGAARMTEQLQGKAGASQAARFRESARLMATLGCTVSKRAPDCLTLVAVASDTGGPAAARQPLEQARAVLTAPCQAGDLEACAMLGATFLHEGESRSRAVAPLDRACAGGLARACHTLADVFERGSGVPASPRRVFQLLERGCRLGEGRACAALAALLEGRGGIAPDPDNARRYRALAATLGSRTLEDL